MRPVIFRPARGVAQHERVWIGGPATRFVTPANYLSKIRLGVRAIERQTDALAPQVRQLNEGLSATRDGLKAIDSNLGALIASVSRQPRS